MTDAEPRPRPEEVVVARIRALQHGYRNNRSESVAALARLRRAVGKPPGSVLDVLQYTLADEFIGRRDQEPSYFETAAHHAMALYALHQQSQKQAMHRQNIGLGRAIRSLHPGDRIRPTDPIPRRFAMLGTSDELDEMLYHLRGVIQLLRAAGEALDYELLTRDLITWQFRGGPERVRLKWGRDFHYPPKRATQDD
ncbi:type I-E CRISPR-associated protein Cse2/CasB [Actinokineospora enzanensis]|uniref:type I-E CRISPR-associated protein Cse2/CasB n=1 Tax=Actinokineospora enzanensis TaxID=155975 RepID=UPI000367B7F8|nr:type I-E CRISPR-associated protein Cse2/CasB [Actinokineospora enzanensis]